MVDIIKSPNYNMKEEILHGAALGIGLVGLSSED